MKSDIGVWLMDVDGVLNPWNRLVPESVWPRDVWVVREYLASDDLPWPIKIAQPVLDFLHKVHDSGTVEIRWHTSWQESALILAEKFGLPEFPIQDAPEFKTRARQDSWWKLPAVYRVLLEEGRPVLWTDDDINSELSRTQRTNLIRAGCRFWVPNLWYGLVQEDLDQISEYLNI